MTDTTEPWPPVPGTGPTGMPETPLPAAQEPPHAPPPAALPEWAQQAPASDVSLAPEIPQPAEPVVAAPVPALPRRRRGGLVVLVALIIVGLAGVLGGAATLGKELTRKATKAEQAAALAAEIASRWQRLPAGKIFPATVSYTNGDSAQVTATRVGIVPRRSCQSALEPSAFQQVRPFGCAAMLRATYVIGAGSQAVTVGIAVFPSGLAAERAQGQLEAANAGGGLYAVPITGTIASTFGNAQRGAGDAQFVGPYVLLYTAGYTDGMPGSSASANNELGTFGSGVLGVLEPTLTRHTSPCTMKDIKC
jgi:hypothetical protein